MHSQNGQVVLCHTRVEIGALATRWMKASPQRSCFAIPALCNRVRTVLKGRCALHINGSWGALLGLPVLSTFGGVSMRFFRLQGVAVVLAVALALGFTLVSLQQPAVAQETTGGMQGTVKDPSGAAVAGASVTVTAPTLVGSKEVLTDGA